MIPRPPGAGADADAQLSPDALHAALVRGAAMARDFYAGLDALRVAPTSTMEQLVEAFAGSLGDEGVGLERALDDFESLVMPGAMAVPHPLYLGLINSSPLPGGIVAESLVSSLNNNPASWQQAPSAMAAETEVVRAFVEQLRLPERSSGLVMPGGSYATLQGLQLAREKLLPAWIRDGARSLSGDPRVYVSDASHFSAERSARALGIAARDVVRVATTGRGAIDVQALEQHLVADRGRGALPFAVVATVGTTGTGAIDPLRPLAALCAEHGVWLHVDACYGGATAMLEEFQGRLDGLAEADSITVDPHKWFYVPMVAALLLCRHEGLELATFDIDASYIPAAGPVDPFRRGLPTSRRAAALTIWMAMRAHGFDAVRAGVRRNIALTRRLERGLRDAGFRVVEEGELSVACARWEPEGVDADALDDLQRQIALRVAATGVAWFGPVHARGQTWMRFNLVSLHTRERHVDLLCRTLLAAAAC